ncbi:hypothetical protein ONE63_002254 [Megalurothrips usitatus]|uniref:FP protein C-terminal domain-containing protein n=1 Tax=Megalurothrips usitatus TaxID=439358 RepID=A0AAV7XBU7_9NEOP|nr:hypothetical protein ONE63_002254 [Megalurothrips usitatus]
MSSCDGCNEELPFDFAQCTSEKKCKLHFGRCAGIVETTWRKQDRSGWKCANCRKATKTEETPVTATEMRNFMVSVNKKLECVSQIEQMNSLVVELKETIDFMSAKYDEMLEKMKVIEEDRKKKEEKVAELEIKIKSRDTDILGLQRRVREVEQYARNRNIEVSGIEVMNNEDLRKVMCNIARKIDVPFEDTDIDVIHRVPSRRGDAPPKIIAQFKTRTTRNLWLRQKRHGGPLVSSELVPNGTGSTRVYLNTHLTAEWQRLLWQAKQRGRPRFLLIWYQENKIIAKKSVTDTRPVYIYGEEDLCKLDQAV